MIKVMVVEDEPQIRRLLTKMIEKLVKPFNMERVNKTLARIRENELEASKKAASDKEYLELYKEKLLIKGKEQISFIDKKDIILIERAESATQIVTKDETYRTSVGLGEIEEKLSKKDFMRCHKSYIINLSKVSKIEPYGRWTYVVRFKGISATALITAQNYEELKKMFL